jgi:maleate isomerase
MSRTGRPEGELPAKRGARSEFVTPVRPDAWAGVLVPPSNPSVEPELARCVDGNIALYASRFAVMHGTTLEQRNRRYLELYRNGVVSFGDLTLRAIAIGLTGPSYRLMPSGDRALVRELTAHAGVPVITASAAIDDALTALRARRICLVSPYPQWLTDESIAYWRGTEREVVQVVKISETFRAYELTEAEIAGALASVDANAVDAIVMSGTGMLTLPAILECRTRIATPILSSNLCCAWWLLATAGLREGSPTFSRAAPELAAKLVR